MMAIAREMIEHSEKTALIENKRTHLGPVFSGKFAEKMAAAKGKADQEFQDVMVAEIKSNVEEVRVLVD